MPSGLSEKEMASDVLSSVKYTASNYMHAIMEAQDPALRQIFREYHDQLLDDQEQMFRFMHQQGWYQVPMKQE